MSSTTGIEWTDTTWNPIRGCSLVSEGCRNCYAERMAHRFSGPGQPYEGLTQMVNGHPAWTGKVELVEKNLLAPLRWEPIRTQTEAQEMAGIYGTRPRRIFVNSMSDLFHPNVRDAWIAKIVAVMIRANWHIYQVLTKRPERAQCLLSSEDFWRLVNAEIHATLGVIVHWSKLPDHVHLGASVEDQKTADERIPLLLQTRAAVRFISAEPLLGGITFRVRETDDSEQPSLGWNSNALVETDMWMSDDGVSSDGPSHPAIDWVICGGESGPGARPMDPDWARGLRDQCVAARVPFFFKQGSKDWPNYKDFDSFPVDLQIREFPNATR